jgi:signal peptidase I
VAQKKEEEGVLETIKVIIQALAIALVIRTLLFQPFNIPSGSMIPTLLIGDYVFVSKYAYGYSNYSMPFGPNVFSGRLLATPPKRGDVVVFKLPRDNETDYIKRVIGLPGDRIQMIEGRLYINGTVAPREPITKAVTENREGEEVAVPTYKETLPGDGVHPGVEHTIIELEGDHGFKDNTELFVVPPDQYFMMGDNRDNSTDSRFEPEAGGVGYVPFVNLVGRAEIIFFSVKKDESALAFWRWPWSVRWDRLFKPAH